MSVPAIHCEAVKAAYRQTKDGLVVSFVIHPNDMPNALAVAPLGTRYMLALAQIGDDEQPVSPADIPSTTRKENPTAALPVGSAGHHPERAMPPAGETSRSAAMKERYAASSEMEKALTRAAMLPKDARFREWATGELHGFARHRGGSIGEDEATTFIRARCCDGASRKLIAEEPECYRRFIALETEFKIAIGQMAEPR